METVQKIKVKNELGKEIELEFIDRIVLGNDTYVIVGVPGEENATAYREVSRAKGEIEYASIGAGAEFKRVLEAYNAKNS